MQNQYHPSGLEKVNSPSDWLWPHSPKHKYNNTFLAFAAKMPGNRWRKKWEWGWAEELCRS